MSWCATAPADDATWWDTTTTHDAVMHQLRLQTGDVDDLRLTALIPAAGWLINDYLDAVDSVPGPPANPVLQAALEQVTIELYRRKDTPAATTLDWNSDPGLLRAGAADPLAEVIPMLYPFKHRWGVA